MIYSYTFLNTWMICPHQAARRFILKDLPKEPASEAMAWGIEVHEAMEHRIGKKKPLPETMQRFEPMVAALDGYKITPELKLGITSDAHDCDFFAINVWLRGKLDAPIINGTTALILDWKTGKRYEDPFELQVGALLLKARKPKLEKIVGRYAWLQTRELGDEHDCSDTDRTLRSVNHIVDDVEACIEAGGEFEKTPGPLCGWCPVTDCRHNRRK